MTPNSIDALLEALKRSEGSSGLPGVDDTPGTPVAAKLSVMKAVPLDRSAKGGADMSDLSDHGMGADLDQLPDDMNDHMTGNQDDDGDGDADAKQNAQIVGALQDQYPSIYDKIMKSLDKGSPDNADAAPAPAPSTQAAA